MNARAWRSLLMVQMLAGLNLNAFVVPKKRVKAWLAAIGLIVLFTPTYAGLVAIQVKSFAFVRSSGLPLESLVLVGAYAATQLMVFLASIPAVYAALFQSNELSILLPLPYHPWQIVGAKLAALYLPELLIGAALFCPSLVLYIAYGYMPAWAVPAATVCLLLLPLIPLSIATIACILIANIPGIGRSRWFWFVGITVALLGASLMLTATMSAAESGAVADLVEVRMRQIAQYGHLMPGTQFAMYTLVSTDWTLILHLVSYLVIGGAYTAAVLILGSRYYIGPVLSTAGVTTKRSSRAERVHVRSFLFSAARKELICTLKDPAVAMNGLGGYIALPLLAVTYTVMKVQTKGKVDIMGQLQALFQSEALRQYLPFAVTGLALGLALFGSLSSLFSASYSKDGKRLWVEKTLPVPMYTVFIAKLLAGYSLLTPLNLLTVGIFTLMVPFQPWQWLYVIVLSQVVLAWNGAAGLTVDCLRPKLVWKDTVQAVKQNMNVVIAMGISMAGAGLNALMLRLLFRIGVSDFTVYGTTLALNVGLLAAMLLIGRAASARFHRIIL